MQFDGTEGHTDPGRDARVEAVRRYNAACAGKDYQTALCALCDAYDLSAGRLSHATEMPDGLDIAVAMHAGETCLVLERNTQAFAFFEAAEIYSRRIQGDAGRMWFVRALSARARAALEIGDARTAQNALLGFDPRLLGILSSTEASDIDSWEQSENWIATEPREGLAGGREVLAHLYHCAALLLVASGQILAGLRIVRRAREDLQLAATSRGNLLSVRLELAEAMAHVQLGSFEVAWKLPVIAGIDDADDSGLLLAKRLSLRARIAILAGDIGKAIEIVQRLGKLAREEGSEIDMARWHLRAASLLIYLNQTGRARVLLEMVAAHPAAREPAISRQLASLTALAAERATPSAAGVVVPLSPLQLDPTDDQYGIDGIANSDGVSFPRRLNLPAYDIEAELSQWSALIRIMLDRNRLDDAFSIFVTCQSRFQSVDSPLIAARLSFLTAIVAAKKRALGEATEHAIEAASTFHALSAHLDEMQGWRLVLSLVTPATPDARKIQARVDDLLVALTASLDPQLAEAFLIDKTTSADRELDGETVALAKLKRKGESTWIRRLLYLDGSETRRLRDIYRRARQPRIRDSKEEANLRHRFAAWVQSLRSASRTIVFVVLPRSTIVVRKQGARIRWDLLDGGAARIQTLVTGWHASNLAWWNARNLARTLDQKDMALRADEMRGKLDALSEELVTALGLEPEFSSLSSATLFIEPDGALINFPFAALRYRGRYLVEKTPVSNRVTIASADRARRKAQSGLAVAITQALSYVPSTKGRPLNFEALPVAHDESVRAMDWFARSGLASEMISDASPTAAITKEVLLCSIEGASHFHFAGHGTFNPSSTNDSGLVVPDGTGHGALISMKDLESLRSVPGYVALTSCYSADSISLPGRPASGITHSVLGCGALNVLASFWQVTDRVSGPFIKHYYEVCTGENYASALATAQRHAIGNGIEVAEIEDTSHPYCWAGYAVHQRASIDVW